jgi:hypothetical protein
MKSGDAVATMGGDSSCPVGDAFRDTASLFSYLKFRPKPHAHLQVRTFQSLRIQRA